MIPRRDDPGAAADRIIPLYREGADDWIAARRDLTAWEAVWIDRFATALPPDGTVLDVGCGSGRPIAETLTARGFRVTGVDASGPLLVQAAGAMPNAEWIEADMRDLDLGRRFDGVLAWCSLFHLTGDDQRRVLPRLIAHTDRVLMFNAGSAEETRLGVWRGEPLHHASLDPEEYEARLIAGGLHPDPQDAAPVNADDGRIWLARRRR